MHISNFSAHACTSRPTGRRHLVLEKEYQPKSIFSPKPNNFFLGGDFSRERDSMIIKCLETVSHQKKSSDQDRGRLLSWTLLRYEVSKDDLVSKKMTGMSRQTDKKLCQIPRIDEATVHAIFSQARTQFPNFSDWYSNSNYETLKQ